MVQESRWQVVYEFVCGFSRAAKIDPLTCPFTYVDGHMFSNYCVLDRSQELLERIYNAITVVEYPESTFRVLRNSEPTTSFAHWPTLGMLPSEMYLFVAVRLDQSFFIAVKWLACLCLQLPLKLLVLEDCQVC
jgi:hypothetical protein